MSGLRNWAGNVAFEAAGVSSFDSIAALSEFLATGEPVRPLGTRHSFNHLADTPGRLVSILDVPPEPRLDGEVLTIGAGSRYAVAAQFVADHGRALPNMGSLPHISIGGAISTGTHGSGLRNRTLSAGVTAVEIVGAGGRIHSFSEGDEEFPGVVVSLGRLGVIARASIRTVEPYLIRQDVYTGIPWENFLADPEAVFGAGFSVSVFVSWRTDAVEQVWVKRRMTDASEQVPLTLGGGTLDGDEAARVISEAGDNTTPFGAALPWLQTLPHFRVDRTPSSGDEIQSEYFVGIEDAADALRAVRALADRFEGPLIISELRTVAADSMWLSPAYRRDSLALHFTWHNRPAEVLPLVGAIEAALEPFAPRPHWGKVFTLTPARLATRYPELPRMRELVRRLDPAGQFRGSYVDALLGLE